ncbi:Putative regulator protein (plasmid) [Streptomyces alboflavus]|uniref:Regulator protein n=1 Tax=Streptomyces alboflavus TaxID=67267 RepID=A0A291W3Q6_9ACTN|nr:ATP-binding protein [Streptomyces alboflavus]ATM24624.1 Putative regulator protein [Streptomyces alboflavus]
MTTNEIRSSQIGTVVQAGTITGSVTIQEAARYGPPPPRELPSPPAVWVDRTAELEEVLRVAGCPPRGGGHRIVALSGPPGIGKTALLARALVGLHDRFPGGQLYVDLRGHQAEGPRPLTDTLAQLVGAVWAGPVPAAPEQLAGWWRSATAAREPLCLLIDNAVAAEAVQDLLPGGSGHLVVATSREPLAELAGDGASLHRLGPLPPEAAHAYLTTCVGEERLRADPALTDLLLQRTGGLPRALWLLVAQFARDPDRPLASIAARSPRLAPHPRPDALGVAMAPDLDTAYAELPPDAAHIYQRLAQVPAADLDVSLAAAVSDVPAATATRALDLLNRAHLLEEAGERPPRGTVYRWPSTAVREHARHTAESRDELEALRRALGWAVTATGTADALITPSHSLPAPLTDYRPKQPAVLTDKHLAMDWLKDQAQNLLTLIRAAHAVQEHDSTWRLAYALWPWWRSESQFALWLEIHQLALEAVRHCNEPEAELRLLNTYGVGQRGARKLHHAIGTFNRVLEMARRLKNRSMEAQALHELGSTYQESELPDKALVLLEKAREIRTESGYRRGVALTDIVRAQALVSLRTYGHAAALLAGARTALLAEGDIHDAARALAWSGQVSTRTGDLCAAERALITARAEFEAAAAPRWVARTTEWLGETALERGDNAAARGHFTEAHTLYLPLSTHDASRLRQRLDGLA